MKKIFIALLILFFSFQYSHAQMVVHDPALLGASVKNWISELKLLEDQYETVQKQADLLKKNIEKYVHIDIELLTSPEVTSLMNNQIMTIKYIAETISGLSKVQTNNSPQLQQLNTAYLKRLTDLLITCQANTKALASLIKISKNSYKMTEFQRMMIIKELSESVRDNYARAHMEQEKYDKYFYYVSFLESLKE